MKNLLLLSSSRVYGSPPFKHAAEDIRTFFKKLGVYDVLFVPYALNDYDGYTNNVKAAFENHVGLNVYGIHKQECPKKAIMSAKGIFIGGGNTFLLLKTLYDLDLIKLIKQRVVTGDLAYMGASAGTNVATVNICTTNDMPIVHPPSFDSLGLVPFNINPHYIEPDGDSTHMGETREVRIRQYHELPGRPVVVGLREGSALLIEGSNIKLLGPHKLKVFYPSEKDPQEFGVEDNIQFLMTEGL